MSRVYGQHKQHRLESEKMLEGSSNQLDVIRVLRFEQDSFFSEMQSETQESLRRACSS